MHGHSCATVVEHAIIGAFHMPLFFFLSGLFLFSKEERFSDFLVKKAKTLLIPCLVFGIILSTYSTFIDILSHNDRIPYGMRYIGLLINTRHGLFPGSLWFFPALFLVEIMLYAVHRISKNPYFLILGSGILCIAGLQIHHFYGKGLPWSLDIALYCSLFTALGYVCKGYVWNHRSSITYIISFVIFILSVYYNYISTGTFVDLHSCVLGNYFLFFISALTGIYLIIGLSLWIKHNQILQFYGQNSLLVYALQFLFLLVVNMALRWIPYGWLGGILQTIVILLTLNPLINIINSHFKWMTGKF